MSDSDLKPEQFFDEITKEIIIEPILKPLTPSASSAELSPPPAQGIEPALEKIHESLSPGQPKLPDSQVPSNYPPEIAKENNENAHLETEDLENESKFSLKELLNQFDYQEFYLENKILVQAVAGGLLTLLLILAVTAIVAKRSQRIFVEKVQALSQPHLESPTSWQIEPPWTFSNPEPKSWADFQKTLDESLANLEEQDN